MAAGVGAAGGRGDGQGALVGGCTATRTSEESHGCVCARACPRTRVRLCVHGCVCPRCAQLYAPVHTLLQALVHACLRASAQTCVRAGGGVCKCRCAQPAHPGVHGPLRGLTHPHACALTDVPALHTRVCAHAYRCACSAQLHAHAQTCPPGTPTCAHACAVGPRGSVADGVGAGGARGAGPAKPPAPRRYLLGHGVDEADIEVLLSPEPCGERGGVSPARAPPAPRPRHPPLLYSSWSR